ncbi:MAG: hypothetical protein HOL01_21325 [Planctomycetaceae bacterium]|jgi:hypothetical protein|nr:hypothetical protein [Planctomycetaceae bacterium]MBT6483657.1 hypothetical protein [Planctomycetaceae bacterium]MBT6497080.1 hypothetical protein [Planctomycetaceae bacterium]
MSGIIGHTMYAILAGKAAEQRKLPISRIIHQHYASYLAGAYLGCDIQTLPEAICIDTGKEVGYGTAPLEKSPLTGGPVKPWKLQFEEQSYTPRDIHRLFYGRSHLVFGWQVADRKLAVPWDHLADYLSLAVRDAFDFFGPGERKLAYMFGWMAHIVGDSLIKSVQPGITLDLLDGKYTSANRPIQDLVSFHEIGRKEFGLNWKNQLADLAETPVEPIQAHYMRAAQPRGGLAAHFPDGWQPQRQRLLLHVLAENRRYQQIRNPRLLKQLALRKNKTGWQCDEELSRRAGGLSYREMLELADKANFRHALWQMGEAIARVFEQVIERQPQLQELPKPAGPTWKEITARWKAD